MHKAQRLIQLIMLVNEKKAFTVAELARECGVSRRTMLRDLMELSELGVPLYSEVGAAGGYRVLKETVLPPISFTESEALAMFFAAQSLQGYTSLPFENEAESALAKFYRHLPTHIRVRIDRMKQRLLFYVPTRPVQTPCLYELLEAALEQRTVRIRYASGKGQGERVIAPAGLYAMNGLWYCQAYHYDSESYRVYRADRVLHVERSEPPGPVPEHVPPIDKWPTLPADEGPRLPLEVSLTREGVRRCQADPWLGPALHLQPDGSGRVSAQMPASYLAWAVGFFMGLGMDAHVHEPRELRSALVKQLKQLVDQYTTVGGEA
ncbi:helix-turn-helix transcriptional regulator [Paenibacillus chartarius]|uniref:Helix-turn-helix transcriptional regulator n=1 Tax=Paenibacillus chartarius TaxID=747481 RepID=A0ABV6DLQ2_9BACL